MSKQKAVQECSVNLWSNRRKGATVDSFSVYGNCFEVTFSNVNVENVEKMKLIQMVRKAEKRILPHKGHKKQNYSFYNSLHPIDNIVF